MSFKYHLPSSVSINSVPDRYTKETRLTFIDAQYGEFISTVRAMEQAGGSTHPKAIAERRKESFKRLYGVDNPSKIKEVRNKAKQTMLDKYGVDAALKNEVFKIKSKNTIRLNYGVDNPMHSNDIKLKQRDTLLQNHGVINPMHNEEIKQKNLKSNPFLNKEKQQEILDKRIEKGIRPSKEEKELLEYIQSLGFEGKQTRVTYNGINYQIDILIKDKNIAFEYNGSYFHSEAHIKEKNYHLFKTLACKEKGIKLIHIFDFEWLQRKEQVKGFIRSMLGVNTEKYNARDLNVEILDKSKTREFLDKHHILGTCNFDIALGYIVNDVIVSVMTFGKHHRGKEELVLSRYCVKDNVTIRGGFTKLCKEAKQQLGSFTSWIDLRWSTGENWINNGWELVETLRPDYFYYDSKTGKIVSKQMRKKSLVGTPAGMTEHEHALQDKLYRVYDCGKVKLLYK